MNQEVYLYTAGDLKSELKEIKESLNKSNKELKELWRSL